MLDKFAEELKNLRISKNLTLSQVAQLTKIDIKALEALENGDFSFQPDLYIKAFIKDYVKVLDEDYTIYIKKFDAAKQGKSYDELQKAKQQLQNEASVEPAKNEAEKNIVKKDEPVYEAPKPKVKSKSYNAVSSSYSPIDVPSQDNKKQILILSAIGVLFVVIILVYFFFIKGSSKDIVTENNYNDVLQENSSDNRYQKPEKPETAATNNPAVNDSIVLIINAKIRTWISIQADSSKPKEYTLQAGDNSFSAKGKFVLFTAQAKELKLSLNSKELDFAPKKNRAKFSVTTEGVSFIEIPSKKPKSDNGNSTD